jgi:hypothetical protein
MKNILIYHIDVVNISLLIRLFHGDLPIKMLSTFCVSPKVSKNTKFECTRTVAVTTQLQRAYGLALCLRETLAAA